MTQGGLTEKELEDAMDRYASVTFERDWLLTEWYELRWWEIRKRLWLKRRLDSLSERHAVVGEATMGGKDAGR